MSLIAKASIEELNNRLDAITVVEDYVRLEKKGGRYWGRCPFHAGGQEKTPSFTVDPDRKMYHCFGCGKGGGIIGFVMEMDKISYPEAIKALARKAGITLAYENGGEERETPDEKIKEQLYELYGRVSVTFNYLLTKKLGFKPAFEYIRARGISVETIEKFKLGYAPAERNWLYRFLSGKKYSPDFLEKSGLFSANYKQMAFFTNRLMFPIVDRQGRTVAFGGRDMPMPAHTRSGGRETPRYLNSRDSEIFKKGQTLFAIHRALDEIRRSKIVYIAEGYMDVIALHQAGITNAVAPLGTAFTDDQAGLLRRWAEKAILVFDTDNAGQTAALKGILTCRKNGLSCALVYPRAGENAAAVPEGEIKDPADILQKFGEEALNKSMKCFISDFEYLIFRSKTLYDVSLPEGKKAAMVFLFPFLELLDSEIERNDCIDAASYAFGTDREAARKDYDGRRTEKRNARAETETDRDGEKIRMNDELFLLIVTAINPEIYPVLRRSLEIREIENPKAKELFVALEECFINEETSMDALLARIGSQRLRNFITGRDAAEFSGNPGKLVEDGIKRIKGKRLRARLAEIVAELHRGEKTPGEAAPALDELLAEKMRIDADIRKLEGR